MDLRIMLGCKLMAFHLNTVCDFGGPICDILIIYGVKLWKLVPCDTLFYETTPKRPSVFVTLPVGL